MRYKNCINYLFLGIILVLFFGMSIYQHLGWNVRNVNLPLLFRFTPNLYFFLFLAYMFYRNKYLSYKNIKEERDVLKWISITFVFCIILAKTSSMICLVNSFLFPILVSISLTLIKNKNEVLTLKKMVMVFYVAECVLAIIEKIINYNFFPLIGGNEQEYLIRDIEVNLLGFRSSAFQSHPLSNALLVDIIMSFILISPIKEFKKLSLYGLGVVALLCFNARSSIIFMALLLMLYILKNIFSLRKGIGIKILSLFFIVVSSCVCYYLMFTYGFGGRLLENELMDKSAMTRVDLIDVFIGLSFSEFLFGTNYTTFFKEVALQTGNAHIENYWVDFVVHFGLLLFIPIFISLYKLFKRYTRNTSFYEKCILFSTFLIISSTNNSLSTGTPAIAFFFICSVAFIKQNNQIQINKL